MATTAAAALRSIAEHPPDDLTARRELYDAAKAVMFAVETPLDTTHRFLHGSGAFATADAASDLHIFETLAAEPNKEWKVEELAQKCGADATLLHRLLRYNAATGLVKEISEGSFAASNLTTTAASRPFRLGFKFHRGRKDLLSLAEFLSESDYRNPVDPDKTLFAKVNGVNIFDALKQNPGVAAKMFEYMAEHRKQAPTWMNGEVSIEDFRLSKEDESAGRVALVDVGGGAGHQCFAMRAAFPELKGKMVVQDLQSMTSMIDEQQAKASNIEPMSHDFFTLQPVKHAKVNYLRNVLHDWPDEPAIRILQQLRPAMAPDSVVILDEIVVPPVGANNKILDYDLAMMAGPASMERTEKHWRTLLEAGGLKLRDVWIYNEDMQWALIVAVPA